MNPLLTSFQHQPPLNGGAETIPHKKVESASAMMVAVTCPGDEARWGLAAQLWHRAETNDHHETLEDTALQPHQP